MLITPERDTKLRNAVAKKQFDLTIILENVHDPHNIGAVLRSCEGVGITEVFVIYYESTYDDPEKRYIGVNASTGTSKWITLRYFDNIDECMTAVRAKYEKIYATHLSEDSISLYDVPLHQSCALMFGNESIGISQEAMEHVDANFLIPMSGMIQSLNISVACAVTLFEAQRQRIAQGLYDIPFSFDNSAHRETYSRYVLATRPKLIDNPEIVAQFVEQQVKLDKAAK